MTKHRCSTYRRDNGDDLIELDYDEAKKFVNNLRDAVHEHEHAAVLGIQFETPSRPLNLRAYLIVGAVDEFSPANAHTIFRPKNASALANGIANRLEFIDEKTGPHSPLYQA